MDNSAGEASLPSSPLSSSSSSSSSSSPLLSPSQHPSTSSSLFERMQLHTNNISEHVKQIAVNETIRLFSGAAGPTGSNTDSSETDAAVDLEQQQPLVVYIVIFVSLAGLVALSLVAALVIWYCRRLNSRRRKQCRMLIGSCHQPLQRSALSEAQKKEALFKVSITPSPSHFSSRINN